MAADTKGLLKTAAAVCAGSLPLFLLVFDVPFGLAVLPAVGCFFLLLYVIGSDEKLMLFCVIIGFAPVSGYQAGFQISEAIYGILYMSFLAYWFGKKILEGALKLDWIDGALLIFLVWVTATLPLTFVFNGDPKMALSEWVSLTMLAFFFPIRFAVREHSRASFYTVVSGITVCIYIACRNLFEYWTGLQAAEHVWQIAGSRVPSNEHILMIGAIAAIIMLIFSQRSSIRLTCLFLSLLFVTGVVVGQSRAVWVSLALGVAVAFVVSSIQAKKRFFIWGSIGISIVVGVAFFLLEDFGNVVTVGLSHRLTSLSDAASTDLSLINRFVETNAVLSKLASNPILGYGLGVPYSYYSLVYETTWRTSFVHNTYVGLLYQHGIIGFVPLLAFTVGVARRSVACIFTSPARRSTVAAIAALAIMAALLLAGTMNNMLTRSDTTFAIAIVAGIAIGEIDRNRHVGSPSPSTK